MNKKVYMYHINFIANALLCEGNESYIVLWVWSGFTHTHKINGILLGLDTGRDKIPVPHELTGVNAGK